MDRLPFIEVRILYALQQKPLESYEKIAKELRIPVRTFYRKVKSLEERNIIKNVISAWIPEKIGLMRYSVFFETKEKNMQKMQDAFNAHPHTYYYSRLYGQKLGFFARFDIPNDSFNNLGIFFEELCDRKLCEDYEIVKSSGYRQNHEAPVPNYKLNPKCFNFITYFEERMERSTEHEPIAKVKNLHPIQYIILKHITKNTKVNQKELLNTIKQHVELEPTNKLYEHYSTIPRGYRKFIEEFFERSDEQSYKEFHRKFKLVREQLISFVHLNFSRRFFDVYPTNITRVSDISKKETIQMFNQFKENIPPFRTFIDMDYDMKGFILSTSLPPYYDAKLNYLLHREFGDCIDFYPTDYFGNHGSSYPFYAENFNPEINSWRTSEEWMITDVLETLDKKGG